MRTLLATLSIAAFATITSCESNSKQPETETPKTDSMATTPAPADSTNKLTAAEQSEGWQLLFDGTSNNSFHVFNKKSDGSAWKVEDGAIHLDTTNKKDGKVVGG